MKYEVLSFLSGHYNIHRVLAYTVNVGAAPNRAYSNEQPLSINLLNNECSISSGGRLGTRKLS